MKKYDYFYFFRILSNFNYKILYKECANKVIEKNSKDWKFFEANKKYGVVIDNEWSWINTINTHSYCFFELYNFLSEEEQNLLDFDNNIKKSIVIFWNLIDKKYNLFFTTDIENKYYNILKFRTSQSWAKGMVTNILFIRSLEILFGDNLKDKKFNFNRGDTTDFKGVDFIVELNNNQNVTVQLKSGKYVFDGDYYILDSANNDLKSPSDYYCFFDISNWSGSSNVLMLKNDKTKIFKGDDGFTYYEKSLLFKRFVNTMTLPQALKNILWFCGPKNIFFNLNLNAVKNDYKLDIENKSINIDLNDIYDDNFGEYLQDKLSELINIFQ